MIPYEETMDRETICHFIREESKGPFFGVVFETEDVSSLTTRLAGNVAAPIHSSRNLVYFSGPLSKDELSFLNEIDAKRKILIPGSYAAFAGKPEHWVRQYAGYDI